MAQLILFIAFILAARGRFLVLKGKLLHHYWNNACILRVYVVNTFCKYINHSDKVSSGERLLA